MKSFIHILLALALGISLVGCGTSSQNESSTPSASIETSSKTSSVVESFNTSSDTVSSQPANTTLNQGYPEEESDIIDFSSWKLALVNPKNALPENFNPNLSLISKDFAGFEGASFDSRAIGQLHAMCNAAKADGIKLTVISAYRTNDFQTYNFNRKVNRVMEANPALTREQAEEEAAKVVARPGTSEHQLGLAVDFNSVEDSFRYTSAYTWLKAHCTEYGFILRYGDDKQDKTEIIPEPWHYRYVGVAAAKAITAQGLCLEEFLEQNSSNN